jgi:hypothetical protein
MVITICAFKFVIYMGNGTSYSDAPISGTGRVRRIKMVYSDSWRAPLSGDINFMSESEKDLASPRRQALPYIWWGIGEYAGVVGPSSYCDED